MLAIIWAVRKWSYGRAHESTDNAQVDGHLVPVLAKVGGFVTAVRVGENDHVKEGAELVHIDDAEYKVRLAQADADLAAAVSVAGSRGVTGQAEAQVQTAASQRQVVDAQIAAAAANRQKAVSDLARMKELADKQIVSKQQLDAAQAAADAAIANENAVQRQAGAAGAGVTNAEAGARFAHGPTRRRDRLRATTLRSSCRTRRSRHRSPASCRESRSRSVSSFSPGSRC